MSRDLVRVLSITMEAAGAPRDLVVPEMVRITNVTSNRYPTLLYDSYKVLVYQEFKGSPYNWAR